ncbi:scavenger receptor cysteine-rich type 1 M130-like protein [Labeo rohita]|uniref:Scavenger receptor cysteine-rich type 1 M130-like protein n=1 Tax=Labeo rohita TaxID=84645 RepID=A0A498NYE2_LABRO|nr:scavenger receptor cysteine-rich type 1 M130-like protein [Labeo rohita]
MRRALSKRHRMTTEAVYEEIQNRPTNKHRLFTQRGSVVYEEQHSGYEDAEFLSDFKEIRLTEGCEGNVEVFYNGSWGNVCWNQMDRNTCPSLPWGQNDCDVDEVAKITCSEQESHGSPRSYLSCSTTAHQRECSDSSLALHDGLVRLSGERQCEGEVEVFIHQVWRRVLLDSWSLTESSVVCRQLGCGSVLNFYGSSSSSPEHSHECVTGFQCSGSEAHLGNCSSPQTLNCSSTQQLSITCLDFKEIRLTEGCEGNVEVFYNGSWGNVCWSQMDRDTASLICQELNCGRSGAFSNSIPRLESAPNWLDKVKCRPHDSNVWQCPSLPWGQNDCDGDKVTKITCSEQESQESPRSYLSCPTSAHQRECSALSKRHRTTTEAVYEEIQNRPTNKHRLFTQRGSVFSEEQHSGYEDAEFLSG